MAITEYEGFKFDNGKLSKTVDALTVEEALRIKVNGQVFTMTMRTPGDDEQLVRGLLHSEGVLRTADNHSSFIMHRGKNKGLSEIDVQIDDDLLNHDGLNGRNLLSVAACGICGRTGLDDLSNEERIDGEQMELSKLMGAFDEMGRYQKQFLKSGGSHAAAIFDKEGVILSCKEDIGRHNATDKVVGDLLLKGELRKGVLMTVSGRISYEIIVKAFKAKIPILCAVSAPSTLAVDYAKELGITLLGFCRENRATCYANPDRIINNIKEIVTVNI